MQPHPLILVVEGLKTLKVNTSDFQSALAIDAELFLIKSLNDEINDEINKAVEKELDIKMEKEKKEDFNDFWY